MYGEILGLDIQGEFYFNILDRGLFIDLFTYLYFVYKTFLECFLFMNELN